MAVSAALRAALRWGPEEQAELADEFLDVKVFTYVQTLADLAREHGVELEDDEVELSDAVLSALRREAREHAAFVVETFNRELDEFLDRNALADRETLIGAYEQWAEARADSRSETIAITEAYTAAADATVAFYRDNGLEVEYDFGGHAGEDDPPACEVCVALAETGPHPHERVVAIGNPHPGCRQHWHARDAELPDELVLGREPAGIVGQQPLLIRTGNDRDAAVAEILALAGQ